MILNMFTLFFDKINIIDKFLRKDQRNANGLQNHIEEIKLFLNQNFIDIILISETHFTSKNYTTPIIRMAQRTELLRYL